MSERLASLGYLYGAGRLSILFRCKWCGHCTTRDTADLMVAFGEQTRLDQIQRKGRCGACDRLGYLSCEPDTPSGGVEGASGGF